MKLNSLEDGIIHLKYLIEHPHKDFSYVIIPETIVNYSRQEECNIEFCREHNIKLTYINRKGSTFLFGAGDFVCLYCYKNNPNYYNNSMKFIIKKLTERGLNAWMDGNDLIIEGHKSIGSTTIAAQNGYSICIISVGIKNQPDLIKQICLKESQKAPQGLEIYGITSQEVEKWFLDFIFYNT